MQDEGIAASAVGKWLYRQKSSRPEECYAGCYVGGCVTGGRRVRRNCNSMIGKGLGGNCMGANVTDVTLAEDGRVEGDCKLPISNCKLQISAHEGHSGLASLVMNIPP
jgi:hypothetical protein